MIAVSSALQEGPERNALPRALSFCVVAGNVGGRAVCSGLAESPIGNRCAPELRLLRESASSVRPLLRTGDEQSGSGSIRLRTGDTNAGRLPDIAPDPAQSCLRADHAPRGVTARSRTRITSTKRVRTSSCGKGRPCCRYHAPSRSARRCPELPGADRRQAPGGSRQQRRVQHPGSAILDSACHRAPIRSGRARALDASPNPHQWTQFSRAIFARAIRADRPAPRSARAVACLARDEFGLIQFGLDLCLAAHSILNRLDRDPLIDGRQKHGLLSRCHFGGAQDDRAVYRQSPLDPQLFGTSD